MTAAQPLNYVPKAAEQFAAFAETALPHSRVGFRYLAAKLSAAEVFVLPDHGELLERSKARPAVPGLVFRPPFPVVALEYQSPPHSARGSSPFPIAPSSRRIALAWEWCNDLPRALAGSHLQFGDGVVVAPIAYFDDQQTWMPISAAMHLSYEDFAGRTEGAAGGERVSTFRGSLVPILPEVLAGLADALGQMRFMDVMAADAQDEVNAYTDLCYALGCGNVETERHHAPSKLNAARVKAGRLPLRDFHVLKLKRGRLRGQRDPCWQRSVGAPAPAPRSHPPPSPPRPRPHDLGELLHGARTRGFRGQGLRPAGSAGSMTDLFNYPDGPGFKARGTSASAAEEMAETAPVLRARALRILESSMGLTADEVAGRMGASILSVRPRISELTRLGKVRDSGERRRNASGKSAIVWAAVHPARLQR